MTKISGTNLSVITREMVPEKFRDKYDWVAKDGGDKGLIDTKAELSRFFSEARLTMLNLKASEEEFKQLINTFGDYAKVKHSPAEKEVFSSFQRHNYHSKVQEFFCGLYNNQFC